MSPSAKKKGMYVVYGIFLFLGIIGSYFGVVGRTFANYDKLLKSYVMTDSLIESQSIEKDLLPQAQTFYSVFPNDYSKAVLYSTKLVVHEPLNQREFKEFMSDVDNKENVVYQYCLLKLNVFNGPVDEDMKSYLPENPENGCETELNSKKAKLQATTSV